MTLDITYSDASYRQPLGGRKVRQIEARFGQLSAVGANQREAREALEHEIYKLAQHAFPTLIRTGNGTVLAVMVGRYDIMPPGDEATRRTSSVLTGDSFGDTLQAAQRHANESYGGC